MLLATLDMSDVQSLITATNEAHLDTVTRANLREILDSMAEHLMHIDYIAIECDECDVKLKNHEERGICNC